MKEIIDAKKNDDFVDRTFDRNFFHDNKLMWRLYGVPAAGSGFQLLCTALASAEKDKLLGINHIKAFFSSIVPVGSEIDFEAEEEKTGMIKKESYLRLTAKANGIDSLGSKKEPAIAEKSAERITFYESTQTHNLRVHNDDLNIFKQVTNLPDTAVPILYSVCLTSASIRSRILNPTTPSWRELSNGILEPDENKRTIPTYTAVDIYFPSGMRTYEPRDELILSSAIMKDAAVYVIDTTCRDNAGRLYGARTYLKQRNQKVLVDAISDLLDKIEKSGTVGSLAEAIEQRKQIKARANPQSNQSST